MTRNAMRRFQQGDEYGFFWVKATEADPDTWPATLCEAYREARHKNSVWLRAVCTLTPVMPVAKNSPWQ